MKRKETRSNIRRASRGVCRGGKTGGEPGGVVGRGGERWKHGERRRGWEGMEETGREWERVGERGNNERGRYCQEEIYYESGNNENERINRDETTHNALSMGKC